MNRRAAIAMLAACLGTAPVASQGQGSCGFHLDVRANLTSTHSAVGDLLGAFVTYPSGAAGSPFSAYATPGSPMALVVNGNPLAYGPAPLGAGSCITMFYAIGAPMVATPVGPPILGPCTGASIIVGVGPVLTALFDSCGFVSPPPPLGFTDTGGRFTLSTFYPVGVPAVVTLQAAGITPGGAIWVTNAVSIIPGPNPAEFAVPAPVACGAAPALDEGQSLANPTPAGFTFYGVPTPTIDIDMNGFVDMVPGVGPGVAGGCDPTGTAGDFGCPAPTATARPRIDVNHANFNFGIVPAAPFVPAITVEFRPFPPSVIYRWKNAPASGAAPGVAGLSTSDFCLELWASPGAFNGIVICRSWIPTVGQVGMGPGVAGQGYFGPPTAVLPSTCGLGPAGLAMMGTFAPPGGASYVTGGNNVVHMNSVVASNAVANSAIFIFDVIGFGATSTTVF